MQALRVGLTYNLKRKKGEDTTGVDREAEYDAQETIDAIANAIRSFGHEVVPLEADRDFLRKIQSEQVDVVFNLAEGLQGRGRESFVPCVLEHLGIPCTGADSATLAVALDKVQAKRIVGHGGVRTAPFVVLYRGDEDIPEGMAYPLLVKPATEGSSKGVKKRSVAKDEQELREVAAEMIALYAQPALVEEFLSGREFTVGLLGGRSPRILPIMEVVFEKKAGDLPIYAYEYKQTWVDEIRYECPAKIDQELERKIHEIALRSWQLLDCRDVGRVDIRIDRHGDPNFIECNPLPGLTPEWSDLCLICKHTELSYEALIGEILAPAIARFRASKSVEQ